MNTASRTSTSSSAKELQEAGARSDTNSDSLTDISFFVSLVEFLNFNINISRQQLVMETIGLSIQHLVRKDPC